MNNNKKISIVAFFLFFIALVNTHGDDRMSRMRYLETPDLSLLVFSAQTTAGPFPAEIDDYNKSTNLIAYGHAGSPGLDEDRESVTEGSPIDLTINVFSVDDNDNISALTNASIYIWHCDAVGVYSSINSQGTPDEKWLRGVYELDSEGSVTFNTIIPGWYSGRILHYHIRVHLDSAAEGSYYLTTQLFIANSYYDVLNANYPYRDNKQTLINLSNDSIYNSISSSIRDKLFLDLNGNYDDGYSSTFYMGVSIPGTTDTNTDTTTNPPSNTETESNSTAIDSDNDGNNSTGIVILSITVLIIVSLSLFM